MLNVKNISDTFRHLGWQNAAWYLLGRALNRCNRHCSISKYYLVAQPVAEHARLSGQRGASIVVRRIERGDPALAQLDRPPDVIAQRFEQNSVCLGAFKGEELAGSLWLQWEPYIENEVRCRFAPEPAGRTTWDYDIFIAPKHRLGYTFPKLWDAADELLRARGVHWTVSRISAFNQASLASHSRLGLKTLGSAIYIVLFRYQLMFTTLPPYVHLSLSTHACPTVRVHAPD